MESDDALPSLRTVQRALSETTERLARECGRPALTAPAWSTLHWRIAQAVAAIHGVSALLSRRLRWQGPHAWQQFLHEQWQQTFARQQLIAILMARIDAEARSTGVALTALKGVALHEAGVYAPGMRPMADVDLLLDERDGPQGAAVLEALGFRERYVTRRERTFEPDGPHGAIGFGESVDRPIKIELQTRIAEQLPICEADITALLLPQRDRPGVQHYPSVGALMMHLLLHAAGNMRTRSLRLIQLNDISALAARLAGEDWDWLLDKARAAQPRWLFPPLALTARYYPWAIPADVLARARADCPRVLRHIVPRQPLSAVSLSHLWIEFCPGIEWCGSVFEMLRYMQLRAFPGRVTRAEMRNGESTQLWASDSPWTRLSRPRRVAHWLVARRARVATMWSVKQAWQHTREAGRP